MEDSLTGAALFHTERMTVRRWLQSDANTICEIYSDPEVSRWIGDGDPISPKETSTWIEVTASNYRVRGYGMFTLQERNSGEIVGFLGLIHPGGQTSAEIKYAFRQSSWGRGLASEAVLATVKYATNTLKLGTIVATVAPANIASQRVLLKAGFRFVEERFDSSDIPELCYDWVG